MGVVQAGVATNSDTELGIFNKIQARHRRYFFLQLIERYGLQLVESTNRSTQAVQHLRMECSPTSCIQR